jgi:hypothetical protein
MEGSFCPHHSLVNNTTLSVCVVAMIGTHCVYLVPGIGTQEDVDFF